MEDHKQHIWLRAVISAGSRNWSTAVRGSAWDLSHSVDFLSCLPGFHCPLFAPWLEGREPDTAAYLSWLGPHLPHLRHSGVGFGARAAGLETILERLLFLSNSFLTCEAKRRLFLLKETSRLQWEFGFWIFVNAHLSSLEWKEAKLFSKKCFASWHVS